MGIFSAFKEAMIEIIQDGASNYTRKSNNTPQPQSTPSPRSSSSNKKRAAPAAPKPISVRIVGESLQIVDIVGGGILRTHSLPPGKYSNIVVSGDTVTVTIEYMHSGVKHRSINARTGSIISEN